MIAEIELPEGRASVVADPDGGAFFLLSGGSGEVQGWGGTRGLPLLAWGGFALTGLAVATGWTWISAMFLLFWALIGLRDGETFLLQRIPRGRWPVTYWGAIVCYLMLAGLTLFYGV